MADRPIISLSEMAGIRREFGPNKGEDVAYLLRIGPARKADSGVGNKKPEIERHGPYGCRVIYVGNMTVREREQAGAIAAVGDYLVSIEAGIEIYTSDTLRVGAKTWLPSNREIVARKCCPTNNPDLIFVAETNGKTGLVEPNWASVIKIGDTLIDGDVRWRRFGLAPDYEIIQLANPNTYSDLFATKMACTLQQKVVPPK